jgi:hypothetical protein
MAKLKKALATIFTVAVIICLVFGVIGLLQKNDVKISDLGKIVNGNGNSVSSVTILPGEEKTLTIGPGIESPWIICKGMWSFDSSSDIEVEFRDGHIVTYHPGDDVDFGARNTFSIRNLSKEESVEVYVSVN